MQSDSWYEYILFITHRIATMLLSLFVLLGMPSQIAAKMQFEDVSHLAGIERVVQTAGSGWGDLNGDGWPDLWVSNHDLKTPSLYLNMQDGTFRDVFQDVVIGDYNADFHGPAWADFDNDGDQDLFLISGGASGRGFSPNFLFINENGKLQNVAEEYGIDYPTGRGRTPLWLDADRDGKLDLLVMNRYRKKGKSPSAIFLQKPDGFVASNAKLGFNPVGRRKKTEKIGDLVDNAVHIRFRKGAAKLATAEVFAQLGDITQDGNVELFTYSNPMRVYAIQKIPFQEITNAVDFRSYRSVHDVAIEDFDRDGKMDIFLVRSNRTSDIVQLSPSKIIGNVKNSSAKKPKEVRIKATGSITFHMHMPWRDPSDPQIFIPRIWPGQREPVPADGRPLVLSPDDPMLHEEVPLTDRSISISYDVEKMEWKVLITYIEVNFEIVATESVNQVQAVGFNTSKGEKPDVLLLNTGKGFTVGDPKGALANPTVSASVAAGDFDNDMDVDLYLVCREPVQNCANILYENDGSGHFSQVPDAGGAAGSDVGRGNQVSMCDYDRDGFLDLFVTNGVGNPPFSIGPHQLFRNKGNENNWLEIDLRGTRSNRDGIGAVVELEAGGVKQIRVQDGGIHSWSQDHQRLHFGLGRNTMIDKLTIRWPSGLIQEIKEIEANQVMKINEKS